VKRFTRVTVAGRIGRSMALLVAALAAPGSALALAETPPATSPSFDVWEFRVLGNTTLTSEQVERAVYPFLGSDRTLKEVDAARAALENLYHEKGFGTVFVDVPEQDVDNGVVRLKVVEGRIAHVRLAGAQYFSGRAIRNAIPAASAGTVPSVPALQEQLRRVNSQSPDRIVVPVLKAGAEPGTVDLTLNVNEHYPLHVAIELNNAHTANTSPDRLLVDAHYTNAFGRLDDASLQYQASPQRRREVSVIAANYAARLDAEGSQLAGYYIRSNSNVASVGALDVLGNGTIVGLRWINALPGAGNLTRSISAGIDWKDFGQSVQLDANTSLSTPVKYLNLSLAADFSDRYEHGSWAFDLSPNFGTRGAVNQVPEFQQKCLLCRPNYFYVRGTGHVELHTAGGFSVALRAGGQLAGEPVIANEQYAVGGVQTVRGYLEADSLGDVGYSAGLQLGLPPIRWQGTSQAAFYVFLDDGHVVALEPAPGQRALTELRSAGAGLELQLGSHLSGFAIWADPLLATPGSARGDSRVLFSVRGVL